MKTLGKTWLSDLKVGEKVGVKTYHLFGGHSYRIGTIERDTPKYWLVDGIYFDKQQGKARGYEDAHLVSYQDAVIVLKEKHSKHKQEKYKKIAELLDCSYTESFHNDLDNLAKNHK